MRFAEQELVRREYAREDRFQVAMSFRGRSNHAVFVATKAA